MTEEDELYDDELQRQWDEGSGLRGIDPQLMDATPGASSGQPMSEPATFSPWLIPASSVITGPLVAALLTLLVDGDPPAPRHAVAVASVGITGWVINYGLAASEIAIVSGPVAAGLRLGVLVVTGFALWAMYAFWMRGKRAMDRSGLINSAVILFALSALFWIGRNASWWMWLGH